ncbi:hypothetical protein PMIN04_010457 [Paraphaeosphaeria minitans]|uniref:Uncharacterized protein n=1 Tax=Paraphaeosphaeria minitans TaxID=565426 RepID=A0A9P6G3V2_9PLEO|nr:hypothetical protein PMIN01_13607 [Paraphaeosphaeria minitans]
MFREFEEQYSPDAKVASGASPTVHQLNPGIKRKRSSSAFGEPSSPRAAIERSLRNAIVLLVLALGKVCSYKHGVLPHPQSDKGLHTSGAWGSFNHCSNSNFNSDTSDDCRPRNIDLLPGMAYFAYATDILGNQPGGHTVVHAQAMILAALYIGQFARVLESWSWINSACRVIVVLIKADYMKLHREFYFSGKDKTSLTPKERHRLNLVLCAYWTCVQLESDILAELSTLPSSNVTQYQNDIMYPANVYDYLPMNGKQTMTVAQTEHKLKEDSDMMIYSSQIWLRVILNEAQNALYDASGNKSFDPNNVNDVSDHAKTHIEVLESWRRVLPPHLAWDDEEPPPTNANIARLRAKYYGALYVILRPYLRIATHHIAYPLSHQTSHRGGQSSQHSPPVVSEDIGTPADRGVQTVELTHEQRKISAIANQCIDAAIRSTVAFDRIGAPNDRPYERYEMQRTSRLVVTNIFGTLHAQFGNMLVLAAVYKSRLYPYLPPNHKLTPDTLNALFKRTIYVLGEIAPNSPILKLDLDILENVWKQLNLPVS